MEEIQLKDICDLDNGYAFKSDDYVDNSNTLNCRMSNIRPDGSFDILYSAKYLPNEFAEKFKDYILHDGDLIIAMTDMAGDPKILGVPTVVDTQGFCLLLNQRVGRLRFIREGVNADYLKLALQCPKVRTYLKRFAGGGVQLNVNKKDILSVPVCMRSEEEQNHIAGLFKRVLEVKIKREQELQILDNLIKARFVEMFGDRYVNDKKWNTTKLGESISFNNGKAHEQVVDENGDYILVTSRAIASDFEDVRRTNTLLFPLHKNDIVMVMSDVPNGKALAKCQLIDSDDKYTLNQRICSFDNYEYNTIFLLHLLNRHPYFLSFNDGNGQTNLRKNDILECELIVPPFELQNQFADCVKQVNKSKAAVQKALTETQLLFDSLMQQYFG